MNSIEIDALQTSLSNEARSLYCVLLRPISNEGQEIITINNRAIIQFLNQKKETISLGRQVSSLLRELSNVGLIKFEEDFDFSRSPHGQRVTLVLACKNRQLAQLQKLHEHHSTMCINWRPDDEFFPMICKLMGVIDAVYSAEELGEFIAYWLGRQEINLTPYQWTQKFVVQLKQRRIKRPLNQELVKAGHQWTQPKVGISFDDNVKQLVKKYNDQT